MVKSGDDFLFLFLTTEMSLVEPVRVPRRAVSRHHHSPPCDSFTLRSSCRETFPSGCRVVRCVRAMFVVFLRLFPDLSAFLFSISRAFSPLPMARRARESSSRATLTARWGRCVHSFVSQPACPRPSCDTAAANRSHTSHLTVPCAVLFASESHLCLRVNK